MKAVIPVAGFGTRFLPATKTQPKEMLPLVDTPIIQYVVEEIVASGIDNIIFITTRHKKCLEDYFDSHFELESTLAGKGKSEAAEELRRIMKLAKFSFVRQNEPLGNGDAILSAAHLFSGEPILVAFGDDIFLSKEPVTKKILDLYEKYKAPVCVLKRVPRDSTHLYGIVKAEEVGPHEYRITDVVEKPAPDDAPSDLAIFGRYVLTPDIIKYLRSLHPPAQGSELGVTDALKVNLEQGGSFYGYEISDELHFDCGAKINFLKATVYLGLQHKDLKDEFREYLRSLEL